MTELTPSEVAAIFDLDVGRVRKDVEYGVFDRPKSPPRFALAEVVYFFALAELDLELGVEDRKKLYRLISRALSERLRSVKLGAYVTIGVASAVHDVERRLDEFSKWKKNLVERDDILAGETVFPKSRLAVRHIGEMALRGAPVQEILEDYPNLSERDVEFAKRYVTAYPRPGRPRTREAAPR